MGRKVCYGWFSETAKKIYGSNIYSTEDGGEVEATHITLEAGDEIEYNYPDRVSLGRVKFWLRTGRVAPWL